MRKPLHLAALAGLLALAAAAAPAAADPVRLDEAALGGVAAGADVVATGMPSLGVSSLTSTSNVTNNQTSVFSQDTVVQRLDGGTANANYATAIFADGVGANGNALSTVAGTIGAAPR